MRALVLVLLACGAVSGCAYYLTPRPPVMERKLGLPGHESVGALATAADYRLAYVRIQKEGDASGNGRICAEPPPDAAGQFAAEISASGKTPYHSGELTAEGAVDMAVSMKELFRRSQGVQFYRDGMFALCNMYLNGVFDSNADYLKEVAELRKDSAELIKEELKYLEQEIDTAGPPTLSSNPKPDTKSVDGAAEEDAAAKEGKEADTSSDSKKGEDDGAT